jgi:mannose-1-phosphate guanylyltransferase/mannose-6-phosphate isomerase
MDNVCLGSVVTHDTTGSYLRGEGRTIATLGVKNLVVVETPDAVLVADRSRAQDVKLLVDKMAAEHMPVVKISTRDYRPWGAFETLDEGPRFKVKHITVKPGGRLSLQRHHHRAEHGVVVKGMAKIQYDDEVKLLSEDQSIYIPVGSAHRLENPGVIPLEIIEVQTGSYLGEDDIVRLVDEYGR